MAVCVGWDGFAFGELGGVSPGACPPGAFIVTTRADLQARGGSWPGAACTEFSAGTIWKYVGPDWTTCAQVVTDASSYRASSLANVPPDWQSSEFLLQALLVCIVALFFVLGYRAGDKT